VIRQIGGWGSNNSSMTRWMLHSINNKVLNAL